MYAVDTRQYPPYHTQTQDAAKRKVGIANAAVDGCKVEGVDAESLMQESAADTTVTVDEVADNSLLNLPTNPMQGLHPHPAYPTQTPDQPMVILSLPTTHSSTIHLDTSTTQAPILPTHILCTPVPYILISTKDMYPGQMSPLALRS